MRVNSRAFYSNDDAEVSPDKRDERDERKSAFRRNMRKGQKVKATVLENIDNGLARNNLSDLSNLGNLGNLSSLSNLAWVKVAGLRLMAALPFTVFPGQILFLVVEELEPEIILKFHAATEGVEKNVLPRLASTQRAVSFAWLDFLENKSQLIESLGSLDEKAVEGVENLSLGQDKLSPSAFPSEVPICPSLCKEAAARKELWKKEFLPNLKGGEEEAAQNILEAEAAILSLAKAKKAGLIFWQHTPWFTKDGKNQEIAVLKREGERAEQIFFSGEWPQIGHATIAALALGGEISCRICVQHLASASDICHILNLPAFAYNWKCLRGEEGDSLNISNGQASGQTSGGLWWLSLKEQNPESVLSMLVRLFA